MTNIMLHPPLLMPGHDGRVNKKNARPEMAGDEYFFIKRIYV